jgi:hypothetical protein
MLNKMPAYDQQTASDFFFAFDNYFLWKGAQHPELQQAYGQAFGVDGIDGFYNQFRKKRKNNTYPQALINYFQGRKASIDFIAQKQSAMLDQYFQGQPENERQAYAEFGQGIIYDPRRAKEEYRDGTEFMVIHTMDAKHDPGGYIPPVGYHRWYGFVRVFTLLNGYNDGRWLEIARNISLAWAIQSKLRPTGSSSDGLNPNNPPLDSTELQNLKDQCGLATFTDLDTLFDHKPFPDPVIA